MKRYPLGDARASLPAILDDVETGAAIEVTRRGKPAAVIVSRWLFDRLAGDRPSFTDAYRSFVERFDLAAIGDDGDVFADLRSTDAGRAVEL